MAFNLQTYNSVLKKNPAEYVLKSDNAYLNQIKDLVQDIRDHSQSRPIILLSGPSGSGKTTTALTLEKMLDESGFQTHTLSLDNYFLPISDKEKQLLEDGKLDLESPARIDADLLNTQIERMINCEPVELPLYDFRNATRRSSGKVLSRKPDELVIFEGIHALNPNTITIPDEQTAKIYVSVRTRISDEKILLHPSKIRLMRRMIRDKIFRNRTISETLKMFESVEIGERRYIMPYKHRSTYDVDTFIPYEISAYKPFLYKELLSLEGDEQVDELIEILSCVPSVGDNIIPKTSLVREFIGNGAFDY